MTPNPSQQLPLPRGFNYALLILYTLLLSAIVAAAAWFGCHRAAVFPEFAQAGDSFGYLQMAQDIRRGSAPNNLPRFTFDSPHSRLLLNYFQSQHVPLEKFSPLLAPDAYHYFPQTDLIVNQYPPGVPLLLSLFPPGQQLHSVNAITASLLLLFYLALCILLLTRNRTAPIAPKAAAISFTAFVVIIGLLMFGVAVSYAIDFFCLPILPLFLALHFTLRTKPKIALLLTLLAGTLFGFAILSHLATILFLPGFLVLLTPPKRPPSATARGNVLSQSPKTLSSKKRLLTALLKPLLFTVATFLSGILPLLIHQNALTGSPFRSTYTGGDAGAPSLSYIPDNAAYYFTGVGSSFSLITGIALLAFALLFLTRLRSTRTLPESQLLSRYAVAILLFIAIPTAFFLTHPIATDYYQYPTILVSLFALSFATLSPALIKEKSALHVFDSRIAAAASLLIAATVAFYVSVLPPIPAIGSIHSPDVNTPTLLHDPNAWIFADRFTGTLWYYHQIPATELLFSDPDTRWQALQFIAARHTPPDPIYILLDNPAIQPAVQDLQHRGALFTPAGTFAEQTIAQLHMPPSP